MHAKWIIVSALFLSVGGAAQPREDPTCDAVSTDDRYVGKRVTLFGRLKAWRIGGGVKTQTLTIYTCETKEGRPVREVSLAFDDSAATHSRAAGEVDRQKVLQRITGFVTKAGSTTFLENVHVGLPDDLAGN